MCECECESACRSDLAGRCGLSEDASAHEEEPIIAGSQDRRTKVGGWRIEEHGAQVGTIEGRGRRERYAEITMMLARVWAREGRHAGRSATAEREAKRET